MARIATPLGIVTIYGDDVVVTSIDIGVSGLLTNGAVAPVREAANQLKRWFAGEITTFDLPLAPSPSTRGQALREAMVAIGYGETLSYGALAKVAGSSARAIGQACARNPFPIVVPCHRVLDAAGTLGAYSAGQGPSTKRWLLDFEQRGRPDLLLWNPDVRHELIPAVAERKSDRRASQCEPGGSVPPAGSGY